MPPLLGFHQRSKGKDRHLSWISNCQIRLPIKLKIVRNAPSCSFGTSPSYDLVVTKLKLALLVKEANPKAPSAPQETGWHWSIAATGVDLSHSCDVFEF